MFPKRRSTCDGLLTAYRRGVYGQDIFTLRSIYLQGRAPKSVGMYWRRFAIKDVPMQQEAFDKWVLDRWREKDELLEYYQQNGRFPPSEEVTDHKPIPNGAGITKPVKNMAYVETHIKPSSPIEFLQIFVPSLALALIFNLFRKMWIWLLVTLNMRNWS